MRWTSAKQHTNPIKIKLWYHFGGITIGIAYFELLRYNQTINADVYIHPTYQTEQWYSRKATTCSDQDVKWTVGQL